MYVISHALRMYVWRDVWKVRHELIEFVKSGLGKTIENLWRDVWKSLHRARHTQVVSMLGAEQYEYV